MILSNGIELIEDNMRRVCRDQAEVCTSPCESADFLKQVVGHPVEVIRGREIESLLQIDAINDEFRITTVALSFAIERDDVPVIFDRTLRPDAADNSKDLHFLIKNEPNLENSPFFVGPCLYLCQFVLISG